MLAVGVVGVARLAAWRAGCCARCTDHRHRPAAVAGSTLHERIELHGPDDELKELADTFDAMLDRLERAFDGPAPVRRQRLARAAPTRSP